MHGRPDGACGARDWGRRSPEQREGAGPHVGGGGPEEPERRAERAPRVDLRGKRALHGVGAQSAERGAVHSRVLAVEQVDEGLRYGGASALERVS